MMGDEEVVHQGVFLTHYPVVLKVNKLFEIERKSSVLCLFLKMILFVQFPPWSYTNKWNDFLIWMLSLVHLLEPWRRKSCLLWVLIRFFLTRKQLPGFVPPAVNVKLWRRKDEEISGWYSWHCWIQGWERNVFTPSFHDFQHHIKTLNFPKLCWCLQCLKLNYSSWNWPTQLGFSLRSNQMSDGNWNSHQSDLRVEILLEVARNLSSFHR